MHRALHVAGTIWGQYSYLFAFALVFAIGCATSEVFATAGNLRNIPHQSAAVGIVALGMALVILTGGIDLSVGSVLAVSGVLALIVLNRTGQPALAVLAALATGATIGLVNGLLIARARIAPFIVTLGGFGAFRALARHLGATIPTEPTPTAESARAAFLAIDGGTLFGMPIPVVIFVTVAGIIFFARMTPIRSMSSARACVSSCFGACVHATCSRSATRSTWATVGSRRNSSILWRCEQAAITTPSTVFASTALRIDRTPSGAQRHGLDSKWTAPLLFASFSRPPASRLEPISHPVQRKTPTRSIRRSSARRRP
jgi:hypothetical protein